MKAELIKKVRKSKRMSQIDVVEKAKELGGLFNQAQLSSWELLKSEPSDKNIEILCKVFECDINDLSTNQRTDKKEIADISYVFGKNFKPQELQRMYKEISVYTDIDKKIQILIQNVLELSTIKAIPLPNVISEILLEKDENVLNNFLINFWNGSIENNSK